MSSPTLTKPTVRLPWAYSAVVGGATPGMTDPDTITPGYTALGWPLSAVPPARQYWNFVLNYCMNGVRYNNQRGIADWDANETYYANAVVISDDGIVRQSLLANNTNNKPSTSPSYWGGLNGYALTGVLGGYVTQAELTSTLANYVTNAALTSTLSNYATITYANNVGTSAVNSSTAYTNAALANYVTTSALTTRLAPYATIAQMNTALASYYTAAQIQASYWTAATTAAQLANYVPLSTLQANYWTAATTAAQLANYYTTGQVNSLLASYVPLSSFGNNGGANPGYCRLPNGMVLQWGTTAVIGSGITQTFPVAMSSVISLVVTATGRNVQGTMSAQVTSTSTFVIFCQQISAYSWFAIGVP